MPPTRHDALREALDAAGANPLIQTRVDPLLLELQRRYAPLVRAVPYQPWDADTYNFNTRTRRGAGGAVRDGGARVVNNSTYERHAFPMAHYQTVGAVTGYAQAVTRDLIQDLKAKEIMGSQTSHLWDLETAILWGSAGVSGSGGPFPQFDGLDLLVSDFAGAGQNSIALGGPLTLKALDQLIDLVETNLSAPVWAEDYMLVMSPTANSKVAQLVTNQQRFMNLPTAEVEVGLIVPTYRNIPIVASSFLASRNIQMGAITTSTSASGGTLAAATYHYQVTAVMERFGELQASAEVSQATTGSTSTVTLSFTPPSGPEGAQPLHYKVYRSTATGTETLLGYVDAVSLNSGGDPVLITDIVDTGTRLETATPNGVYAGWPTGYVGTNTGAVPPDANEQTIYLIPRNRDFLLRACVREQATIPLFPTTSSPDELPYAVQTDCVLAVRGPTYVGRLAGVSVDLAA